MLDFFNSFTWLRLYPLVPQALRLLGILMVVTGGIWAAFQRNLARLFGYAVIIENGFSLLALSFGSQAGYEIFVVSFLPRAVALALWALSLALLKDREGSLDYQETSGLLRRYPLIASGLLMACFSLAGLPLLAGFPVRIVLLEQLSQQSMLLVAWALVGSAGLFFSGFRALAAMAGSAEPGWKVGESRVQVVLLGGAMLMVLLIGLLPGQFLPGLVRLLLAFQKLY